MTRCSFADDHDLDSAALGDHLAACDACACAVATRRLAQRTWSAAKVMDDRTQRPSRERRLVSGIGVGRALHRRSRGSVILGALVVAACSIALWLHARRPLLSPMEPAIELTTPGPVALSPTVPIPTRAIAPKRTRVRVVEVRGGASHDGTALSEGATVEAGEPIDVAPRATLRLSWVLDVGEEVEMEAGPPAEVLVTGPARVEVGAGSSPVLVVRRGVARVTEGEVMIAHAVGSAPPASAVAEAPGHPAGQRPADDADAQVRMAEAERELQTGDRAGAEATLRTVVRATREPSLRARAELMLAELLLARGEADEARRLLAPLAFGGEPRRAADAAWLYARSLPTPGERADAWARYLATSPPPAMRALALIERASALLDAGDVQGARDIAASLDDAALAPVAADALRRLRARLRDR